MGLPLDYRSPNPTPRTAPSTLGLVSLYVGALAAIAFAFTCLEAVAPADSMPTVRLFDTRLPLTAALTILFALLGLAAGIVSLLKNQPRRRTAWAGVTLNALLLIAIPTLGHLTR